MSESVKEPPAVFRLNPGEPDAVRREQAAGVYVRHFYERMPWADAYFQVYPNLDVKRHSAETMACRLVAWLRHTYPLDIANQMEAHGLGTDDMLEKLRHQSHATTRVKVGEKYGPRRRGRSGDRPRGSCSRTTSTGGRGMRRSAKQMAMHGHGAGASRKPLSDERKTVEGERRLLEEPEDMPKTMEEAIERGEPITLIEHPDDMPPDEWQREWEAYQAEREAEERERGPL